jgi:hypothetical protein
MKNIIILSAALIALISVPSIVAQEVASPSKNVDMGDRKVENYKAKIDEFNSMGRSDNKGASRLYQKKPNFRAEQKASLKDLGVEK